MAPCEPAVGKVRVLTARELLAILGYIIGISLNREVSKPWANKVFIIKIVVSAAQKRPPGGGVTSECPPAPLS